MEGLFLLPFVWEIVILAIAAIWITASVEAFAKPGSATAGLAFLFAILWAGRCIHLHSLHWHWVYLVYIILYVVCGLLWVYIKWNMLCSAWYIEAKDTSDEAYARFQEHVRITEEEYSIPYKPPLGSEAWPSDKLRADHASWEIRKKLAERLCSWEEFVPERYSRLLYILEEKPVVNKQIGSLVGYGMYWPLSVAWSLLSDFIAKLFQWLIIRVFGRLLQHASDWWSRKLYMDVNVPTMKE